MSPTSILKGCIAIFMDVSRTIRATSPNIIAPESVRLKLPALGRRHITIMEISEPRKR